ncbi:5089_t:CDS:2, partial [Funneliformis geosporum]
MSGTNSSTGNLKRHLDKNHPNKVNPSVIKQATFMKQFLEIENNIPIVFTNEIFCEKLSIWIAVDDQPFTVVDCPEFQELIKTCIREAKVPSADTIRSDILKLYKKQLTNIQCILQNTPGKISFTLDCWTSSNIIAFLGSHSGENMAKEFLNSIQEFHILTK